MPATNVTPWGQVTAFPGGSITYAAPQGGGGGRSGPAEGVFSGPGEFASAIGGAYAGVPQGLGQLAGAYGSAYGGFASGLASLAQTRANSASNARSAAGMAEAARQAALGSIGAAALGAYGSASNSALSAWAANQQSYNQALASMHGADQQGVSNYGMSRNSALAPLANAYATLGKARMGSNALADLNFNMSGGTGGGMSAGGPDGPVAYGTYGGDGFNFSGSGSRRSSQQPGDGPALEGLAGLRDDIMSGDVLAQMGQQARSGANRLDMQHYTSRNMPSRMLGQTLSGLMQLQDPAYKNISSGMSEFYSRQQPGDTSFLDTLLREMSSGYRDANANIGGVGSAITGAAGSAAANINSLFRDSLGKLDVYLTPLERQQRQWELQDAIAERRAKQRAGAVQTNPRGSMARASNAGYRPRGNRA